MKTWDILVPTFYARTPLFVSLLDQIERQLQPGVRVIAARGERDPDHLGDKCQQLLEAASGDYTCFAGDDAILHQEYVPLIHKALQADPDCVGFALDLSDVRQVHSIAFHGIPGLEWPGRPDLFWGTYHCDLGTWMPVRRSLGVQGSLAGAGGEDDRWTRGVVPLLRTEVFISEVLVKHRGEDPGFHGEWGKEEPSPDPERDFVTYI